MFHEGCILPWLEKHNTCPSCRKELPTDDLEHENRRRENPNDPITNFIFNIHRTQGGSGG
jgi:hypothetical protein